MSFHTLIIVGNLGSDPVLRYAGENPVTTLSVASNRQYTDGTGKKVKETTWFKVSVWDKQAESCNTYLKKGSSVLVEGELKPDKETGNPKVFQKSDGSTGASYEVTARTVRFLSGNVEQVEQQEEIPF